MLALAPQQVLANYATALTNVNVPTAYTFEYVFERQGDRPQEQRHRVYREASKERDEILSLNGEKFAQPEVRIFTRQRDRYTIGAIAPNPDAYAFTFVRSEKNGHHLDYVFEATPRSGGAYIVTQATIDGETFLPRRVVFRTQSGAATGTGEITYAKVDRYWMPQTATARAVLNGKLQTERIAWARYGFYPSLPPSTWGQVRAAPSPPPGE